MSGAWRPLRPVTRKVPRFSPYGLPDAENTAKPGTGQGGERDRDRVPGWAQVHRHRGNGAGHADDEPDDS